MRVNKSTPKLASELSKAEIRRRCSQKQKNPRKRVVGISRRKSKRKSSKKSSRSRKKSHSKCKKGYVKDRSTGRCRKSKRKSSKKSSRSRKKSHSKL